jgi:predicted PurR-regulated permease PerM
VIHALLRLFPQPRRKDVREFLQLVENKLGGYIRGEAILCSAVGVAAFIAYALIGLPYVLVLGIFAGVMEMVPIFGPALGAAPAFLVAISLDPQKAIWVVVAATLIQLLENTVLVPRIMRNSLGVNQIIVLLSLIAFGSVFGIAGGILALPLAAIIQLLVSRVVLLAAESARRTEDRKARLQTMMKESEQLMQNVYETSNRDASFQRLPEGDRMQVYNLAEELNQVLRQMGKEGEGS